MNKSCNNNFNFVVYSESLCPYLTILVPSAHVLFVLLPLLPVLQKTVVC